LLLTGDRKYEEALHVFGRGLAVDPDNADLWNRLGGLYGEMGRSQDSINARLKYVALQPSEANAYDSLGMSYQAGGRYDEAVSTYQRALELNPKFNFAVVHLGNTFVQTGQYIAQFRRYLQDATSDFETRRGYRNLAVVELRRGRLTDALAFARKAGVDLPLTITEARIRIAMGEPPDRIAGLLRPPPVGPNRGSRTGERPWCNVQGLLALKRGAADEAIGHFRSGVQDRPTSAEPEPLDDILANAYLELGRYDDAIGEFDRILRINPRYPLAHFRLGLAYEKKGQPAQARRAYEQFLVVWLKADKDAPELVKARERIAALQ
jgi:tetratricopeptide (TPR) repeat protein